MGVNTSGSRIDDAAAAGNSLPGAERGRALEGSASVGAARGGAQASRPDPMTKKSAPGRSRCGFSVEVRGVEPLSANRSLPVSTCVFYCSFLLARSSASRQPLTSQPCRSYSSGHGTGMSQPEFSSPVVPTQAGLTDRREVRNQLGFYLRSQGEVIVRSY